MLNMAADRGFDQIAETGCFLDSRSGFRPQMEFELSHVGAGKEVFAQPWKQEKRRKADEQKGRYK